MRAVNFSLMTFSNSDLITFSIILPPIGVLDIGLKSESERGGLTLGIGMISAFLYSSGKIPV